MTADTSTVDTTQVDELRLLGHQESRRHRQRAAGHAPHHQSQPTLSRPSSELQRVGQTAGFVQLDVDHLIAIDDRIELTQMQTGFVST